MKIVVLGGCGTVGATAVGDLVSDDTFSEIVVADKNIEKARGLVSKLDSDKLSAVFVDVADAKSLRKVIEGASLVLNVVGPFYRFAEPITNAVIEEGINCVDICDDYDATMKLLEMDEEAREAGITVLTGMGSSPGLANLLAKFGSSQLDETEEIHIHHVHGGEEDEGAAVVYHSENAEMAVELGANSILVNYLTVGLSAMRMLAEDPSIDVPVMAHMDFAGAIYESPWSGVSSHLILGKLPRICGADIIVTPAPYGKARILKERYMEIIQQQVFPLRDIKPSMPMPSGGIATPMVEDVIKDIGYDIMLGSGGAIHSHPMGPEAGTRAFRQAIDAVMDGKSLGDAMEEYEELRVSIDAAIKAVEDLKDLM